MFALTPYNFAKIFNFCKTKIRSTERIFSHYYFTLMELLLEVDCTSYE